MKHLSTLLIIFLFAFSANGQIENTFWQGTYKVPNPTEMIVQFSHDTLYLNELKTGEIVEIMNYSIKADTLTVTKISGTSPCSIDEKGIYKLTVKGNLLFISLITDACYGRRSAMPSNALTKL